LWTTTQNRAQWFTGEIHIVNKSILPTTDRSNFIENDWRERLYAKARDEISSRLNREAQRISDNRQAFDTSEKIRKKLEECQKRLSNGQVDRADLKTVREEITDGLEQLRHRSAKCTEPDFLRAIKEVSRLGTTVNAELANPKFLKNSKPPDIAAELKMTTKAKKLFEIVMEVLQRHYAQDKDQYHRIAEKIYSALRKKY
jgi:hypothetical protein